MVNASPVVVQRVRGFPGGNWTRFEAFIILMPGAAFAIGALNDHGAWYAALNKPPLIRRLGFFAPVWSVCT